MHYYSVIMENLSDETSETHLRQHSDECFALMFFNYTDARIEKLGNFALDKNGS